MKCLDCGTEMEHGSVEGIGQGGGHWYEFTSNKENKSRLLPADEKICTIALSSYTASGI